MSNLVAQQQGAIVAQSEEDLIRVLQNSLYPGAQIGSVQMVLGYCQAAGLDPMQKPVHIVPMWDGKAGAMRDVVMPGVNLYRTMADRTGKFAGMSEPEYGPMIDEVLGGQKISYPEWCRITVEKLLENGAIARFTAIEYWVENYAMKGGKEKSIAPNAMWLKRPRGQIAKCAEAQALRKAFPECSSAPTAEEMEGKSMGETDITPEAQQPKAVAAPTLIDCTPEHFKNNTEAWRGVIKSKRKTPDALIAMLSTKLVLSEDQKLTIDRWSHEEEQVQEVQQDQDGE